MRFTKRGLFFYICLISLLISIYVFFYDSLENYFAWKPALSQNIDIMTSGKTYEFNYKHFFPYLYSSWVYVEYKRPFKLELQEIQKFYKFKLRVKLLNGNNEIVNKTLTNEDWFGWWNDKNWFRIASYTHKITNSLNYKLIIEVVEPGVIIPSEETGVTACASSKDMYILSFFRRLIAVCVAIFSGCALFFIMKRNKT